MAPVFTGLPGKISPSASLVRVEERRAELNGETGWVPPLDFWTPAPKAGRLNGPGSAFKSSRGRSREPTQEGCLGGPGASRL